MIRVCLVLIGIANSIYAQELRLLFPSGATQGQPVKVTCYGKDLKDTRSVVWMREGIEVTKIEAERSDRITLHLHVPEACELGTYLFALHTERGLTRTKGFRVGEMPSVPEGSAQTTQAKPQKIALNVTIDGRIQAEDVDWYAFDVAKGQTVHAEVEGVRLGLYDLDLQFEIFDPDGKMISRSDDTSLGKADPISCFTATQAGTYKLAMRDVAFRGSSSGVYRLHIGTFPRPIGMLPAGGNPGEELSVRLLGEGAPATATITMPTRPGMHDIFAVVDGQSCPSPMRVLVDKRNNFVEGTLPPEPPEAPCAFHGIIAKANEEDRFAFRATKGRRVQIQALAHVLRSPLDPLLIVRDAKGKALSSSDDASGLDGRIRFTPPSDGIFFACVRDHLRGGGDSHFYRIEVGSTAPIPGTAESVPGRRSEDLGVAVPRGRRNATMIRVSDINTRNNITLTYEHLPKGVTARPIALPSTALVPMLFTAASDAVLGVGLATPMATSGEAAKKLQVQHRHILPIIRVRNNEVYDSQTIHALPVVVTKAVPFDISVQQPRVPIVRSGSLKLPISLKRDQDYRGTVTVRTLALPAGVSASTVRLTGDKIKSSMSFNANSNAAIGEWPIVVVASASIGGVTQTISSELLTLRVSEPWLTAKLPRARMEQGQTASFEVTLEQKHEFEGKITAVLGRIPKGVTCTVPEITVGKTQLPIGLQAAKDARVGRHRSIYIQIKIETKDGVITHNAGSGEIRVDKPLPVEVPPAPAKPTTASQGQG